jgi:hypothetical protein
MAIFMAVIHIRMLHVTAASPLGDDPGMVRALYPDAAATG